MVFCLRFQVNSRLYLVVIRTIKTAMIKIYTVFVPIWYEYSSRKDNPFPKNQKTFFFYNGKSGFAHQGIENHWMNKKRRCFWDGLSHDDRFHLSKDWQFGGYQCKSVFCRQTAKDFHSDCSIHVNPFHLHHLRSNPQTSPIFSYIPRYSSQDWRSWLICLWLLSSWRGVAFAAHVAKFCRM